jgi:hypothetical protein
MADDKHVTVITPVDIKEKKASYVTTRTNAVDPTRDTEVSGKVTFGDGYGKVELGLDIAKQFDAYDLKAIEDATKQAELDAIITTVQSDIDTFLDTRGD